jgi:hypothetical protein
MVAENNAAMPAVDWTNDDGSHGVLGGEVTKEMSENMHSPEKSAFGSLF